MVQSCAERMGRMECIMFTKQHYNRIAATILCLYPPIVEPDARRIHFDICKHLADMFTQDNANFDQTKFIRACGWIGYTP